jgi:hypothetical protein
VAGAHAVRVRVETASLTWLCRIEELAVAADPHPHIDDVVRAQHHSFQAMCLPLLPTHLFLIAGATLESTQATNSVSRALTAHLQPFLYSVDAPVRSPGTRIHEYASRCRGTGGHVWPCAGPAVVATANVDHHTNALLASRLEYLFIPRCAVQIFRFVRAHTS